MNQKSSILKRGKVIFGIAILFSLFSAYNLSAQFTQGNLVVLQIGDGVSTMTSQGNALTLNEYNPSGTLTYSVPIPTTGSTALVLRGNATSEGYISRSTDGSQIVFGAYNQALPNTTALNSAAPSTIPRGIGMVNASGVYNLATSSTAGFAAGDIRGAAATGTANYWGSSSSQGANYYGSAATATNVQNSKTNLRATHIFNGQLYISSQVTSGSPPDIGVYAVGSGTPTTSGQTVTTIINCGSGAQPGQFFFNSAGTICYVADARNNASGGIQKWVNSSSTWSLAYTLPTGTAAIGAFGVVADFSGNNPVVYATTSESNSNRLISVVDAGASSTATTLATAGSNYVFRGLAFSPFTSTCVPVSITNVSNSSPVCSADTLVLNSSLSGSAPYSYTWTGSGQILAPSSASTQVLNSASGNYILHVSNACGTASAATSVTSTPTPTIQVNAATICSGGVATITASGATTYSWNTGSTSASFTASPTSNTNYTVIGYNGSCTNSATTSITLTSSPVILVNSATLCAGASVTLTATGATTYTWSTGSNNGVIVVTPGATTSYTVNGNVAGCSASLTAIAQVSVNPLPSVSLTASPTVACINSSSVLLSGTPSGGTYSGTAVSGTNFNPNTAGTGNYTLSYRYTDPNGCANTATTSVSVISCIGVNEVWGEEGVLLFPNPAQTSITLYTAGAEFTSAEIYDLSGRKVTSLAVSSGTNVVNIEQLSAGVYIIKLHGKNLEANRRFVKE